MIKIEKYHDWLNENKLSEAVSKHIEHPFIELASDVLEEHDFEFLLESSRVQLRNGTLLLKHLSNYEFLDTKFQELGVKETMRKSGMSDSQISSLCQKNIMSFTIYSTGNARMSWASRDSVTFQPTREGLEKTLIPWLKRYLLNKSSSELSKEPSFVPDNVKINKTIKGYTLPHDTLEFIEKELSGKIKGIDRLSQYVSTLPEPLADSLSPYLELAALLNMASMDPYVNFKLNVHHQYNDGNFLEIDWEELNQRKSIDVRWKTVRNLSRNLEKLDYFLEIAPYTYKSKGNFSISTTYQDLIDSLPEVSSRFLEAVKSPLTEQEMKDQIHRKRGTLKGSEFGF